MQSNLFDIPTGHSGHVTCTSLLWPALKCCIGKCVQKYCIKVYCAVYVDLVCTASISLCHDGSV